MRREGGQIPDYEDVIRQVRKHEKQLDQCAFIPIDPKSHKQGLSGTIAQALGSGSTGKGLYVLYEGEQAVYVGRSDDVAKRLLMHGQPRKGSESATLAFNIAMEEFKERE